MTYELENGNGIAVIHLREGQAKRLRSRDLPSLDRPLRVAISHGRTVLRAESLEEALRALRSLPRDQQRRHRGRHRSRRR